MSYSSFASVYDELMKKADYKERAEYICNLLASYGIKDGLLLDLACGTGSLSLELSKKGFEVIGTDASPDMLMEAREKAMKEGEDILFLCQRMEETDLYGTVRAITCTLDSLNHLKDIDEVHTVFGKLKNFIDVGGIMIFDVNTLYKHRCVLGNNTFVYDEKNVYCVWQNKLYPDEKTVGIDLDFFVKQGNAYERYSENFKEVAFTEEELKNAFEGEGFALLHIYKENTTQPVDETTERAIYVIKRV